MSTDISLAKIHVWMVVGVALHFLFCNIQIRFEYPKDFLYLHGKRQEIEATH